jgi:GNAT superfamily N-acetyltransferase
MPSYHIRAATLDDVDALAGHRLAMFTDMRVRMDRAALDAAFRKWLGETMLDGSYRAWLAEDDAGAVVGGGGITVIPWPPGPHYMVERLAFVYNVYTEPTHRRRGVGRLVMEAIHDWCRGQGIQSVALNASGSAQSLYESMGYQVTPNPMMFCALAPATK